MKTINEFLAVATFLGDNMTEEQSTQLMDQAKHALSIAEIETLSQHCPGSSFYTRLTEYNAEMGGLSRY
jgi:hypothetical protein